MTRRAATRFRPTLSKFEERLTPATTIWIGGTFGQEHLWSAAANWSNGIPKAGDTAVFQAGSKSSTPAVNVPFTIGGIAIASSFTGVLIVNQPLALTGMSSWSGGTITNHAGITNTGLVALDNPTAVTLNGIGTLTNAGTITQTGQSLQITGSAIVINGPAGLYDVQTAAPATSAAGRFVNEGLVRKSVTAGLATFGANFSNAGGTIEVQSGTLAFAGSVALKGGTVKGSGTLAATVINGNGIARPGGTPGRLILVGDYTQGANGRLRTEHFGTTAGAEYDQLTVTGRVSLGGLFAPAFNFVPAAGTVFTIIDNDGADPISGTFAGLANGAVFPAAGGQLQVAYNGGDGNDVTVTVITPPTVLNPGAVERVIVNAGATQRSRVDRIRVEFEHPVTLPENAADAFQLHRQSDNAVVTLKATPIGSAVDLTFTGGASQFGGLADGRYTLTVVAANINDGAFDGNVDGVTGDNYTLVGNTTTAPRLFRYYGDGDGDGDVDAADFAILRSIFPTYAPAFDFDSDGDVDTADFGQFRARFNTILP